ncbi:hypothetical protein GOP47_0005777 [Adiantum capillus-veneris]|uniref:RING-type domain-containing protein n=1 Tax=Adiantum capillus-veneris TaxID=13818 RepID=A0A9D4V6X6_ADICA|nr:hypothetical protein GOP47_0005777 [Adiantum capillus-veneris]
MKQSGRSKMAKRKKKGADEGEGEGEGEPGQLAVSWPRQVRAYERLRRMQQASCLAGEKEAGATHGAEAGGKASLERNVGGEEGLSNDMLKAKAVRRIASVQRLVRVEQNLGYEELAGVRNAAKALFQEIDGAMERARAREAVAVQRRMEEQETTIRWLEMGHCIFQEQKNGLQESHSAAQRELRRQLQEEREKAQCLVCLDHPRNTLVLPCLHFQYCLDCLLLHRARNGNSCPSCRRSIEGLCMASSLAAGPPPPVDDYITRK